MSKCEECVDKIVADVPSPVPQGILTDLITDLLMSLLDGCLKSNTVAEAIDRVKNPNAITKFLLRREARRLANPYKDIDRSLDKTIYTATLNNIQANPDAVQGFIEEYNAERIDYSDLI
jgi:hypothetical protein